MVDGVEDCGRGYKERERCIDAVGPGYDCPGAPERAGCSDAGLGRGLMAFGTPNGAFGVESGGEFDGVSDEEMAGH